MSDLFKEINNAVLDIQAASYQNADRPLKRLAQLLKNSELGVINQQLTVGVDLDKFISASENTGGSMVGSHKLIWPDDRREDLGLRLLLIRKIGEDSNFAFQFSHRFYASGSSKVIAGIHGMNRQLIMPFVRDYQAYVLSHGDIKPKLIRTTSKRIFIVHGHDVEIRETVARFLEKIGFESVILQERANRGQTIIEKIEAHSDVGFAVVLLTPDDVGRAKGDDRFEERARQNVLLELGYFMAKLGRERICALRRGEVMIPSDFAGVVWETFDEYGGWKQKLARELHAAGHNIEWTNVMT